MPTVLRSGPYRIYFFTHEPNEPPHVHVDRDKASCKVWLVPVALSSSLGFAARVLRDIEGQWAQQNTVLYNGSTVFLRRHVASIARFCIFL
jgi:hypothetical protein